MKGLDRVQHLDEICFCRQQRKQALAEVQPGGKEGQIGFGRTLPGAFPASQQDGGKLVEGLLANDPMESGTPDATSAAPRMYTQDSYREDQGISLPRSPLSNSIYHAMLNVTGNTNPMRIDQH